MQIADHLSLEFKALQDEILENSKKVYQIISSTIGLCAALIGYCFSTSHFGILWARPFALLSPFLILIPAMILLQANQLSTVRIAGYLKVVFEEYSTVSLPGWQSAVQWCRENKGPRRIRVGKIPASIQWNQYKKRLKELIFLVEPETSDGRHLHAGLRGILCGIALTSTLGSLIAWWWLIHHDRLSYHPHFASMIAWYLLALITLWWLFLLACRDMREGWEKNRFLEWQIHWRTWAASVARQDQQSNIP